MYSRGLFFAWTWIRTFLILASQMDVFARTFAHLYMDLELKYRLQCGNSPRKVLHAQKHIDALFIIYTFLELYGWKYFPMQISANILLHVDIFCNRSKDTWKIQKKNSPSNVSNIKVVLETIVLKEFVNFILKSVDLIDHTNIFLLRTINHYVILIMCTHHKNGVILNI